MHFHEIFITLMIMPTLSLVRSAELTSDTVNNWGDWGEWDLCPDGTFVKAINIKVEPFQGKDDDTGLNAVHLSCVELNVQVTDGSASASKVIKSAEGPWGELLGIEVCNKGIAIGFQLRSEELQENGGDDTAANDMRLICASRTGEFKTAEKGHKWGSWREEKRCPNKTAVCGLRTQVEKSQGSRRDDTALNNVAVRCCELPDPSILCDPTDDWQEFSRRENSQGTTPWNYTHKTTVGVHTSKESSETSSLENELSLSVGFGVSASFGPLAANFETKLGYSTKTGHTWSKSESSLFKSETEETFSLSVPPKCDAVFYRIVGKCGSYVINSNAIRRVDKCTDGREVTTFLGNITISRDNHPSTSNEGIIADILNLPLPQLIAVALAVVVVVIVVLCCCYFCFCRSKKRNNTKKQSQKSKGCCC